MTRPISRFPLHRLLLAIVLTAIFFLSLRTAVDPDYGWHVANGRHFWDGVLFAGRDVYSWASGGREWIEPEWLSEVTIASVHDTVGPTGNSLLASAIVTATFALVALRLRRRGAGVASTMVTVFLGFTASLIGIGVRVQMVALLFSAAMLFLIDAWLARKKNHGRATMIAVAGGAVLWANSHGSYPLLFVFLVLTSVGLFLAKDERWTWFLWATLLASIAVLLNPWGWDIYPFSLQSILSPETKLLIEEWRRPVLGSFSFIPFDIELVLVVMAIAFVALDKWPTIRRDSKHDKRSGSFDITSRDALIAGAVVYLALQSARHVMLVGICAGPVIAFALERAISNVPTRMGRARPSAISNAAPSDQRGRELINLSAALAIVVVFSVIWWPLVSPAAQQRAIEKRYPVGLLSAARSATASQLCIFNEYTWGGFLEQHNVLPVFIDGRGELYGVDQLIRYGSIIHLEAGWQHLLDSLGVDGVFMSPAAPLALAVQRAGWQPIARDNNAVLLLRPGLPHRGKCRATT